MGRRILQFTLVGCLAWAGAAQAGPIGTMDSLLSLNPDRWTFATSVLSYEPIFLPGSPSGDWADSDHALGSPDYANKQHFTSLGRGGSIVLGFGQGALSGSGTAAPDLIVGEIGPDMEDTFGWVSSDGLNWQSLGRIAGGTAAVDLDALGFGVNDSFSYLRLVDDPNQGMRTGLTVGADIDAVAVMNATPVPEPGALILLSSGLAGLVLRRRMRPR